MKQKRADKRKYHYIYRITRFDGKYYIGLHSTDNLNDGYFGSGARLWRSINKHGIECHTKEILEFLPNRQSLREREAELVNDECLRDPFCLNLVKGGGYGWEFANSNPSEAKQRASRENALKGTAVVKQLRKEHPERFVELNRQMGERVKLEIETGRRRTDLFKGRQHTDETKQRMSDSMSGKQTGERNSQFGTIWITDGYENKKIKDSDLIPDGWRRGRIRKLNLN